MAKALRQSRYRVTTAEHFTAALNVLESTDKPDILVTDLVMPRSVNGVALSRMARLRHPKVATVFISGHDVPGIEAEKFGSLLRKPIKPSQLIGAVEAEFARRAAET